MTRRQQHHQVVLNHIGVLVLVDQDVLEALSILVQNIGVLPEEADRVAEQVVEVHGPGRQQAGLVTDEDLADPLLVRAHGVLHVLPGGAPLVLGRRDRRVHGSGRKPLDVKPLVAHHIAGEAHRVALIVDAEAGRKAEAIAVAPQDPDTRRMEGRHPHAVGHRTDQFGHPLLHLAGRLVGEGDGQDGERRHAPFADEVGDTAGENPGLA